MTLITVTELREEADLPSRNIDLTEYTDPQLQEKINWATAEIQRGSKRFFTPTQFTKNEINYYGSAIFLEKTPVTSIETFQINGIDVDTDSYILHPDTGEVEFTNDTPNNFDYTITYTVCEDPEGDITLEAKDICTDLIFIKLQTPNNDKDIKSFRSGDTQIQYEQKDPTEKINQRITNIHNHQIMDIIED